MPLPLPLFSITGLLLLLHGIFPDAVVTIDELLRIVYLVMMMVLVFGMSQMIRRRPRQKTIHYLLIWLSIIALLVLGYNFYRSIL